MFQASPPEAHLSVGTSHHQFPCGLREAAVLSFPICTQTGRVLPAQTWGQAPSPWWAQGSFPRPGLPEQVSSQRPQTRRSLCEAGGLGAGAVRPSSLETLTCPAQTPQSAVSAQPTAQALPGPAELAAPSAWPQGVILGGPLGHAGDPHPISQRRTPGARVWLCSPQCPSPCTQHGRRGAY